MAGNDSQELIGLQILQLASTFPSWVPRREEIVDLVDAEIVRRTVHAHVDLTPLYDNEVANLWHDFILLPVAILDRAHTTVFDVRGEDGGVVSRLTVDEERGFLLAAILLKATIALKQRRLEDPETVRALTAAVYDPSGTFTSVGPECDRLMENESVMEDLRRVGKFFHLVVPVDPTDGLRRVISYSYLSRLGNFHTSGTGLSTRIEAPAAGYCGSYHLTVNTPPDLRITNGIATFRSRPPAPGGRFVEAQIRSAVTAQVGPTTAPVPAIADADVVTERLNDSLLKNFAHIHVANIGTGIKAGEFHFRLIPSHDSLIRTAMLISSLALAALIATYLFTLDMEAAIERGSATTLLLLFPGALGPVLSTIPRHPLPQSLLLPTRVMLWMSGLACYVGAALVAFRVEGGLRSFSWGVSLAVAIVSFVFLVWQWATLRRMSTRADPPTT